jgi:hypothetical protein
LRTLATALLLFCLFTILAPTPQAQTAPQPIAVVSLVWGEVTIKHADADYKPARWLEPIFAGDFVKTTGPGSKLLITYFFDNHQEVLPQDAEATATPAGLRATSGGPVRQDAARNPFGSGGVESPFVYTKNLSADDFVGADDPNAMQREANFLKGSVIAHFPPTFSWPASPGTKGYTLTILDAAKNVMLSRKLQATTRSYKLQQQEASKLFKGTVYTWGVTDDAGNVVLAPYPFMLLSRPQDDWLSENHKDYDGKVKRGQLQRSDRTDRLLVGAQLVQVGDVLSQAKEMAKEDPNNPQVYRVLTRAYLLKGCPAHAKQAHDREIELGGIDPVGR